MDACLKRLLNKKINVASIVSYDGPQEVLGPISEVSAYVETKSSMSSDKTGTGLVTKTVVITESEIKLDDRVWLPSIPTSDLTRSRKPLSVNVFNDENGRVSHYESEF